MRRAQILGRRQTPAALLQARELYADVARDHARSPVAQIALQAKLRLESDRKNLRELDPVMNIQVPAYVPTMRQFIEQFNVRFLQQLVHQFAGNSFLVEQFVIEFQLKPGDAVVVDGLF